MQPRRTPMPFYNETALVSTHPVAYRPTREVRLTKAGQLIAAAAPRYDRLDHYIAMFGAPLSALKGNGLWTFADPIEQMALLVECEPEPVCERCAAALHVCSCAF